MTGLVGVLGYVAFTHGATSPKTDLTEMLPAEVKVATASLAYSGSEPVLTGSVDHLFATASFTGPNRSAKTNRVRPQVDALALSRSFEEVRVQLASLREPAKSAETTRFAKAPATGDVDGSRIAVASINPAAAAALDAIAGIAPNALAIDSTPVPMAASEQLAYARANAPVTGSYSTGKAVAVSDKERWCLATAIYFEARGELYRGQVAVAQVVMNRVKDHRYPNTICGVVFQNQNKRNSCQFSFACDGIPEAINDQRSWAQAEDIAERYVDGELYLTEVGEATHYHATYVRPAWAPRMQKLTQIGLHVFYKFKSGWMFG